MFVSTMGIVLAGTSLAVFQWYDIRANMANKLVTITRIIADNTTSAVSFVDTQDANEVLLSLKRNSAIIGAIIYDSSGKILAHYARDKNALSTKSYSILKSFKEYRFIKQTLEVQQNIYLDDVIIGKVLICSDLSELNNALLRLTYLFLTILVVVGLFAYFLTSIMQKIISQPLLSLAKLTRKISQQKNYTLRAKKSSDDELGALADDFNEMISQIEKRDKALTESEHRFHILIEQAADAIYLCDLDGNILHVHNLILPWDELCEGIQSNFCCSQCVDDNQVDDLVAFAKIVIANSKKKKRKQWRKLLAEKFVLEKRIRHTTTRYR